MTHITCPCGSYVVIIRIGESWIVSKYTYRGSKGLTEVPVEGGSILLTEEGEYWLTVPSTVDIQVEIPNKSKEHVEFLDPQNKNAATTQLNIVIRAGARFTVREKSAENNGNQKFNVDADPDKKLSGQHPLHPFRPVTFEYIDFAAELEESSDDNDDYTINLDARTEKNPPEPHVFRPVGFVCQDKKHVVRVHYY